MTKNEKFHRRLREELPDITTNEEYVNTTTRLTFSCSKGHTFETSPKNLFTRIKGCKQCKSVARAENNTISEEVFRQRLHERNRKFDPLYLKGNFHGTSKKTEWECGSCQHTWAAAPKTILRGHGCPVCSISKKSTAQRTSLQEINATLLGLGITCLRKKDDCKQLEVMCHKCSHIWYPSFYDCYTRRSNCPKCSKSHFSKKAIAWLDEQARLCGFDIQHAGNGGEYFIDGIGKVDGFHAESNTVFEFHGDMWHGNPALFDPDDINPVSKIRYGELYKRTMQRDKEIRELGYNLFIMWESDFPYTTPAPVETIEKHVPKPPTGIEDFKKEIECIVDAQYIFPNGWYNKSSQTMIYFWNILDDNIGYKKLRNITNAMSDKTVLHVFSDEWNFSRNIVLQKIRHITQGNGSVPRVHARKCNIGPVTKEEKKRFLEQYHIQGNCSSSINIGARDSTGEIVAIMTFTEPRAPLGHKKKGRDEIELSRFVTSTEVRIPGIASKMFKYAITTFFKGSKTHVFSYSDTRWSTGNLYDKLGFVRESHTESNYWYVVDQQRQHRWNFTKRKLQEMTNLVGTESELAETVGLRRVYDCGTVRHTYEVPS